MDKLGSFLSGAQSLAGALGTNGEGQFDRGNGKIVKWSFKGQIMGFEWKYIGICVDQATGETATAVKQSRDGSIEHSMRDLFQKLAARGAL
ncbi:uncharacterized protein LOC133200640 [Saccostrea echinata]|uniref:uncharacterized protein LOC133200640 n=1 Tax=Saccostrea echinata TaxID=191078 RepID=UPI002A812EBE|nr:uncharacterized protein LOC133200640 [Saccostrea echinata]